MHCYSTHCAGAGRRTAPDPRRHHGTPSLLGQTCQAALRAPWPCARAQRVWGLQVCWDSAKVQLNSGILERRHQNWAKALGHFRHARAVEPGYCEPTYWIGATMVNAGMDTDASLRVRPSRSSGVSVCMRGLQLLTTAKHQQREALLWRLSWRGCSGQHRGRLRKAVLRIAGAGEGRGVQVRGRGGLHRAPPGTPLRPAPSLAQAALGALGAPAYVEGSMLHMCLRELCPELALRGQRERRPSSSCSRRPGRRTPGSGSAGRSCSCARGWASWWRPASCCCRPARPC